TLPASGRSAARSGERGSRGTATLEGSYRKDRISLGPPPMISLSDIRAAARRLAGRVHRTPLVSSVLLGERAGVRLFLKCESFQKTGSFKARGALNKVLSLPEAERARGLVTVSAGNHAAAVAWAAREAGCSAVVVMPTDAPRSKID